MQELYSRNARRHVAGVSCRRSDRPPAKYWRAVTMVTKRREQWKSRPYCLIMSASFTWCVYKHCDARVRPHRPARCGAARRPLLWSSLVRMNWPLGTLTALTPWPMPCAPSRAGLGGERWRGGEGGGTHRNFHFRAHAARGTHHPPVPPWEAMKRR